jgi:GDPmannose 4,6-dehydratase
MKKALITGISSQDGSYLTELLLSKGYEVWGTIRRHSVAETQTSRLNEAGVIDKIQRRYADMTDSMSLIKVLQECMPNEIYHLAAQSHVRISFDNPVYTTQVNAVGTLNLLEAARLICPMAKIYNAATSEMYGNTPLNKYGYLDEFSEMKPVSPYGSSKLFAYNICKNYRDSYRMFISNGILFNHESPRRGTNFVSAKIIKGALDIKCGKLNKLKLGNMDSVRDWGHAKDYVRAMWMMLQHSKPDDFVVATGSSHSVKELCEIAFKLCKLDYKEFVEVDKIYLRPTELTFLRGNSTYIEQELGWLPRYSFEDLVYDMHFYFKDQING